MMTTYHSKTKYGVYKVEWEKFKVIKLKSTETGSLRLLRFNLYRDKNGFYIGEKERKTYLNHQNCLNMLDF